MSNKSLLFKDCKYGVTVIINALFLSPLLKYFNCSYKYFSFCPANLGQSVFMLLPSVPWHAIHDSTRDEPAEASPDINPLGISSELSDFSAA